MNLTMTHSESSIEVFEPEPNVAYTIETVSRITQIPRHTIAVYCRHGLVAPAVDPEHDGWFFDQEGIRTLRRIEQLRESHAASLDAIALIFGLMRQVEDLQQRLRLVRL